MADVPANPKIYHITPISSLSLIAEGEVIWSDAKRIELRLSSEIVGMRTIKRRRLEECDVDCHPGTKVGQYVPFYFCPRSVMLYILYQGNHPDLDYRKGQRPIVHLQADLKTVVEWADREKRCWAFTDCNASARYANFYADVAKLDQIDWDAVEATDWQNPTIKEHKQAEFLLYESFPWELVEQIGVRDDAMARLAEEAISEAAHKPLVRVMPGWYYLASGGCGD